MKSFGPGVQERKSLGKLINVMALMFTDITKFVLVRFSTETP